eukprot:14335035-Alexandrium_andersonii.AAC.1
MSGTQAWGKKNIPKFQREEWAFLKILMTAVGSVCDVEHFEPLWDINAAKTRNPDGEDCWIAAVRDTDE